MKNFLLLLSLVLLFLPNKSYTQWVSTNGPGAGQVNCMVLNGSNIFAGMGAYNGVFISTNTGASWTPVNTGLGIVRGSVNQNINALAVIGSNLFAGTSNKGVYMSTNNGTSWTAANTGIATSNVQALAVIGSNLFAGCSSGGAFISTDNGTSWTSIASGLGAANVKSLVASGANLFAGLSGAGINISTNNGTSWASLNNAKTTGKTVQALATDGTNLFAGTSAGCYRSALDTGWADISTGTGIANANVFALAISGSDLFAGGVSGYSHSINNGTNWSVVNTGIYAGIQQGNSLLIDGSTVFAGSINQGIFATTNNGANWSLSSNGLTNDNIQVLYSSGSNVYAGTGFNGVFRTTDNGTTWNQIINGIGPAGNPGTVWGLASAGGYLFAGTNGNRLCYRSSDNGNTWTLDSVGLGNTACRAMCSDGPNLYYGLFNLGVYKSTDAGATWAQVGKVATGLTNLNVRGLFFDGANVFCGTSNGGVFKSTDNGASWTAVNTGLTISQQFLSFDKLGIWNFAGSGGNSAYRSSNGGANWTAMSGLPATVASIVHFGNTLYCATNTGGSIFQSSDSGSTWTANYGGVVSTNNNIQTLTANSTNLFLGSQDNGVWRLPLVTSSTLNLTALIEGFYNGTTMVSDTVTVQLHNSTTPYALVESTKGVLNSSGLGTFNYTTAANGAPYYIAVKHRNGIETWSASTPSFSSNTLAYDFTSAQAQAFGNNQTQKGSKWCIYSGDVNQDGIVDSGDLGTVDNDNSNFVTGYTNTDVNGDGIVDSGDLGLVDNNNSNFVGKIVPSGIAAANRISRKINTSK